MGIVAHACADAERLINSTGDSLVLIESDGTTHNLTGTTFRVDYVVDPDTGTSIMEPAIEVQIPIVSNGLRPDETWQATIVDGLNENVTGQVMATRYDRSRCVVVFWIEAQE